MSYLFFSNIRRSIDCSRISWEITVYSHSLVNTTGGEIIGPHGNVFVTLKVNIHENVSQIKKS